MNIQEFTEVEPSKSQFCGNIAFHCLMPKSISDVKAMSEMNLETWNWV